MQLSDTLCRHIAESRYDELPAQTHHAAARAILDATGVMLAASGISRDVEAFVSLATADDDNGPCSILGTGKRASAPMAAFANGAMAHALDFEDAFDPAPCHPNAAAVPAAIAIAQAFGPIPGREITTAIALGCDLVCRMGLSLEQPMEQSGWYPPPILGAFGATATAARILELDAGQTRDALSLTLCQATMPGEIMHSRDTVVRAIREAFPAQSAVLAALLARRGVRGFEAPLEGNGGFFRLYADGRYDASTLLDGLGNNFWIEDLSFKPWPACRGTHAYIEIALDLVREHGLDWRDIDSVTAITGIVQRMLFNPVERKQAPKTVIDAKFSIPFTVAVALVRGDVALGSFDDAALNDADVLAMARRIRAEEHRERGREHAAAGELVIRLADGRELRGAVDQALGHPESPLSTDRLVDKFVDCCSYAARPLDDAAARELADRLLAIETAPDCGELFRA